MKSPPDQGRHLSNWTAHHESHELELEAEFDAVDLSDLLEKVIDRSGVMTGTATLFNAGSTGALTTIEYESGCLTDLRRALDVLASPGGQYAHNARWGDGNGFSHLRAALLGPSLSIPVLEGRPVNSTWQQVILLNFDNRSRKRTVHFSVVGVTA